MYSWIYYTALLCCIRLFCFFFFEADRATTFSDQTFNHVCGGETTTHITPLLVSTLIKVICIILSFF